MHQISLYSMATLYILAGLYHFKAPNFYLPMMPAYIPNHHLMILLSGIIEVVLGLLLLWPKTTELAAWGIILMLLVFFTVHIHMFKVRDTVFAKIPNWLIIARLPLHLVLIMWAFAYT